MLPSRYGTLRAIVTLILFATAFQLFAQSASKPNAQAAPESTTTSNPNMPAFKVMTHPVEHHLQRGSSFNGDVRTLPQIPPEKFERPEFEQPEITPVPYPGTTVVPQASATPFAAGIPSFSGPAPSPSIAFDGLDFTNWGAGHPPDTNGDVGPLDYVQTINTSVGIYRKSDGVRLAAFTFNTLLNGHFGNLCDTNNFGDPVVVYDTFEDRWIITDFAFQLSGGNVVAPQFQCFAVSKSGDPVSGGWNFYSIQVNGALGDYPKFGIWPDGLYMSANLFGFGGGSFQNVRVWAFNKAQMYAGAPTVQVLSFDAPSAEFTLLPSNARLQTGTPPAGSPNYFAVVAQFLNAVSVYKFHVNWNSVSTSTFSGPFISTTATSWSQFTGANGDVQSPGNLLDTLYFRLMVQNQYTNISGVESLWNSHTVGASGSTSAQTAPRFYQVNVTGGSVAASATQAFTYSPDATVNRYMPSVAVDRAGDMAIGYSATNAGLNPAIRYAGRLAGDPVNSITQTETSLIEGTGTQSGNCGTSACTRWGDYSAMTLAPDGCTLWYTNLYYQTTGLAFNTRIGAFSFPSCTPVSTGTLQGTVTASGSGNPISGATVALGSRTTTTAVDGTYSFVGLPSGTYPSITASFAGFVSGSAANIVVSDGLTTTQNFSLTLAPTSGCLTDTTQADFQTGVPTNCDLTSSPGDVILVNTANIDQQNTTLGNSGVGITITTWGGQTFTPSVTGQLTRADINLFCSGCTGTTPNLTLSLRATSGGLPTGADLASATVTGFSSGAAVFYTATFGSPPTLTAGTLYALVIRPTANPSVGIYALTRSGTSTTGADVYAGGTRVAGATSGTVWSIPTTGGITTDAGFKTYMQTGFTSLGTFVSSIKDANPASGATPSWSTLSWTASTPANTAIKFQAAASNSISGPFNFVGPDGTAGTFFTNGGSLAQFNGNRYLEYQVSLTTTDSTVTPTLNDVTVCFSNASALPPTISKSFGAPRIAVTGTASLSFTISNPNAGTTLTGIAFSDTLPAGLVINTPNGLSGSCGGGTITATQNTNVISLSGASLAASGSCTFSVNVLGTAGGDQNNTTGNVTSTEGGTGGTASATINVIAPPTLSLAFNPTTIAQNATTSLQFTITNPAANTTALNGVAFTDNLPTGLTVVTSSSTVCGGTLSTTNPTTIHLSGATVNTNSQCIFSVTVTGASGGNYSNTVSGAGSITSTTSGIGATGPASNTATLTVVAPPSIAKVFNPNTIALNATTSLTFTITNPAANTVGLTGVAFTDTLPTGLTVANSSATVCGGTLTTTAPTGIALSGATINTNSQCQFSVTVTGAAPGQYTNTTGNVTSTNGGTGNTASANLTVAAPPTISKAFGASTIPLNGSTSLSFTITNPNTFSSLSGVAFTDNLPAGLVVATTPNVTGSCGSGTITATAGSGAISLSGGTLTASTTAGSSCTFSVSVTGTTAGTKNNTTGNVTSTEGGTGTTSNTAVVTVVAPTTISKAFTALTIPLNGTATLTFTITNPNTATTLTGVSFSDTLPSTTGTLVVSSTPNVVNTCAGIVTATAGTGVISLSGGNVNPSASCTLSVDVKGTAAGDANNTTGAITSNEGGTGATSNTATLKVVAPPSIAKAFNPTTISLNATTTLTLTVTNPAVNTVAETGVAFADTLPTGLVVSTPNGLSSTCGGTATAVAGSTSITLTGGSIAVNASCTVIVTVTGTAFGSYTNTTGPVSSTNGGTGNTASAGLAVANHADIAVTLVHHPDPAAFGGNLVFVATVTNNGPDTANVTFTENFAGAQYLVSAIPTQGSCSAEPVTCSLGSMTNGQSATVTITVTPLQGRNIIGTAKATTDITDTNVNNSTASSTGRIRFKPFHF
ncbi:MAG TPA: carboxypeptidase regulatory-like domain-containing protein [Terriglobales bacterium]|jgi:uncharacterized repeat protein (TIGR01451 family)|nr:carboxypeptidase regulatory-like domain-containing protein [Terriglobales bacterium]